MRRKNDYSVIIFSKDRRPAKYTYVHDLNKFSLFVFRKFPQWTAFNVYDRRKGTFLKQFRPGQYVPRFL